MTQIEIGSGDSIPPEARSFAAKAKAVAIVITSLTALLTAVTAIVKVMDTSLQQKSYEQLAESIKKVSEDSARNNDDIKALREYLDKDREARKAAASAVPSAEPAPTVSPMTAVKPPKPRPPAQQAPVPPPPPEMSPKPPIVSPPDFKSVADKASRGL